ncbi:hypothetical protein Bca52824_031185 [Brassica carinata]|uniref:Disease resistance protein n=1 Tax=Brassica carinata TaxID=52824 RepID=A0A8X7V526_BRACI|nr:hypothetical protein Bca52824_031185 [Brassica carinata]
MADTLLSFGVERLWNLLVRESERFQGVEEQFNGLKRELEMLRCFLEDADAKKHTSAMVRNTIKDIKEIVFDAEDIVETFILKEELGYTSGIRNIVRRFSFVILERRGLAFDMEAISKRISKVIRDMQSLSVQKVIVNEGYTESLQEVRREMRHTFSTDNRDHLVGLEETVKKLVGCLVDEDSSQVVSITGMGGIGKTTLARQVFNHETIKSHFSGLAWVCVSQHFERQFVWQTILRQLRPEYNILNMKEDELQEKLVGVLETQKALIVIDDIWKEGDWDRIKHVFIPKKGWKVLLTSRNEGVALYADRQCVTFKPECLTFEESWELFQRIAFPTRDAPQFKVDEAMEEMGKHMIKHCGGLPLAVKVLGGLLASQYTLREWKRIYENIRSYIVGGTNFNDRSISSVYHVLDLSFEEMPVYLKQSFLYLAHFPEDYQISVENLSYYWAAEGILPRPRYYDEARIRDVADGYIEELVKINMIISERDVKTSRFETCQLHDMMREVCLRKAEEEDFVKIIGTSTASSKSPCQSRRLAVHWPDETFNVETEVKNPSLRNLLFISDTRWEATSLLFTRHKLMRVLDLSEVKFEGAKLPSSIGKLIHLRYLSLKWARVTHLPSSMRNLKQLFYLNLHVREGDGLYMPNFLKQMRELTYLWLPKRLHDNVKLELGNLVKLETLKNFSTEHGSVSDLKGMTRLKSLSIYIRGKSCTMETLSSSLSKLPHLENLTIDNKEWDAPTNDDNEEGFVLDNFHLRQLNLRIYMPRLPEVQKFPSHLTTIDISMCRLKEDPMLILEKLVQLREVRLGDASFCGRRMVCSRGGFPQLQKLELWKLEELEEWIIEEGSMPLLNSLEIAICPKLKEIPDRLRFISSLETLQINKIGEKWKKILCMPSHLTTISLSECPLKEDPMPILEKLLYLKKVELRYQSFAGRRMVCSRDGFPQLKTLWFGGLKEWEEWVVEEGSMPLLHTLSIQYCGKLKEIPDRLQFITSLEDLSVDLTREQCKMIFSEGYLHSRLTYISLTHYCFEEDPMPILKKLLHLKMIHLHDISLGGNRMVCSRGGFPQLQRLQFDELEEWEEWIVEEGSMPLLRTLTIWDCQKLKELPDGLRFITSLEYLRVQRMGKKWKKRLSEGGEDYYKVKHVPSIRFY